MQPLASFAIACILVPIFYCWFFSQPWYLSVKFARTEGLVLAVFMLGGALCVLVTILTLLGAGA